MFDDTPDLPTGRAVSQRKAERPTGPLIALLDGLTIGELLELRTALMQRLPKQQLQDMNLEQELVLQVLALQQLQADTLGDEDTPANQKAQVANSLSASLTNLVKLQGEVYTSERLKRIEVALAAAVNNMNPLDRPDFMEAYGRELGLL